MVGRTRYDTRDVSDLRSDSGCKGEVSAHSNALPDDVRDDIVGVSQGIQADRY